MSGQRHPGTEALASLRAGMIRGLRGRRLAAHVARCDRCASVSDQLGAVSSTLASVPAPALPEAFESRITAAIAAEATARQGAAAAAGTSPAGALGAGSAGQDAAEPVVPNRRQRPAPARHRQPGFRFRPAMAFVPVIALVLAGFGFLLSRSGPSSSSSSALSQGAASASVPAASAAPYAPARSGAHANFGANTFVVTVSGTHYQAATLRTQVLSQLQLALQSRTNTPVPSAVSPVGASSPGHLTENGTAGSAASSIPSPVLVGCVRTVTRNVEPSLVDQATYDGKPAYVIAVPGHAWVVGLDCTASKPDQMASVPLTGAP